jgi:sulfotransferase
MYHFISGLPRAGSTLLASILNQNPACSAAIMSPTGRIVTTTLEAMGTSNEAAMFVTDKQRLNIIRSIFDAYYADDMHNVIFDNNRRWTANISLLAECFPDSRMVCCVRSPAAIVDSFERLFQSNPLNLSVAYGSIANTTVYDRTTELMKPTGVVGFALNAYRTAFFGPHKDRMLTITYDDLARFPAQVMTDVTKALGLPDHNYQFDAIEQIPGVEQFDREVSTPGLHTLGSKVVYTERQSVLPPDIWRNLPPPFWQVKEEVIIAG